MKKILILFCFIPKKKALLHGAYLATVLLFCSCSKSKSPDPAATSTYFKFTADGYTYVWDVITGAGNTCLLCGSYLEKFNGYYFLHSTDPTNYYSNIALKIAATDLSATSYTLTTTTTTPIVDANYRVSIDRGLQPGPPSPVYLVANSTEVGDFATITISRLHDGYADGTFTARITLSPYGPTAGKLDITNGEFKNVKITQ